MMRIFCMLGLFALAAPVSQAGMVIDDFNGTTLGTRTFYVSSGGSTPNASATVNSGSAFATDVAFGQLTYTFASSMNLSPNYSFSLTDFEASGSGEISLVTRNTTGITGTETVTFTDGPPSDLSFVFDTVVLSDIKSLTFNMFSDPFGTPIDISFSSVQAVPEPTSIALVSLAGLGGLVVRRRRKVSEVAAV
ncbi:PEP-CTERM sorting domain-containing protein [Rhodopirellula bahusiensis]|uniref:PEP-CTERM sorting domain-containing protein n=1 Tax=Rhodopirellula bahusiensis TaxID=2014065 RepID=UPI003264D296